MLRRLWRHELDSHLTDLIADLKADGYSQTQAEHEAKLRFGDIAMIEAELMSVHPWLSVYADWIATMTVLVGICVIYLTTLIFIPHQIGLLAEHILVWWSLIAIGVITVLLLRSQQRIIPLTQRAALFISVSSAYVIALTITAVLDINNFETALYNSGFVIITSSIAWLFWEQTSLRLRSIIVYTIACAVVLFAWREQGWLEHLVLPNCLYVHTTGLELSANACEKISWFNQLFWLVYATLATAIGMILWYINKLWRQASASLWQKGLTTMTLAALPFLPITISGVNSTGAIDVIAWKVTIDQAYEDILGRHPQAKDYEFYAATRSYDHMSRVRDVLYQSYERRLKINLLFQEYQQRDATPEEIDHYVANRLTINEIIQQLQTTE